MKRDPDRQILSNDNVWSRFSFITRIIKQFSSNTLCFIVSEATCFGPYMIIIRPSYESSQEMLATCWDPNYVYN